MSDTIDPLQEAFELQNLQSNTSLLEYGLRLGLIEEKQNGQIIMELLNIKLMSSSQIFRTIVLELLMRLGVFVSATGLVKSAIDSHGDTPDAEDGMKCLYVISIIAHQIMNFDELSIRTINRILMSIAIILFSLTSSNTTQPCEDMKKFKQRIKNQLAVDYYLWCLLFAMDLVLTCTSPLHINLEQEYGYELNISHVVFTTCCVINLNASMQIMGHGRLVPLIFGSPLIFLDAGDSITMAKGLFLFLHYLLFWSAKWRDLVDCNHSMLCEAGVCKLLSKEKGNLWFIVWKSMRKLYHWRMEEGLDDEGWFLLLDPPASHSDPVGVSNTTENEAPTDDRGQDQEHQLADYTGRVVYLQSRNPLLTSLAAIILMVWR